jgi:hypothetical protein
MADLRDEGEAKKCQEEAFNAAILRPRVAWHCLSDRGGQFHEPLHDVAGDPVARRVDEMQLTAVAQDSTRAIARPPE